MVSGTRRRMGRILERLGMRRFGRDRRGVSAIEFALILPLMLALYLGAVELGDGMTIKRKVTRVTSALGDLVTQSRSINNADMKNILDAGVAILTPYPANKLRIRISGVTVDGKGVGRVTWSDARGTTPHAKNSVIALPAGLKAPHSFLVTAEVNYTYKPIIGYTITGTFDLKDQFFLRPRISPTINRVAK